MMFVSLAAGAIVQSTAAEAAWLVPAITASATLLGTAVGGGITFWTTRSANIRQEKAAEKRRKLDEVKDVSIRFIRLLTNQGYESMRLKQRADDLHSQIVKITSSRDSSEEKTQDAQVDQSPPHRSAETDATGDEVKSGERGALEEKLGEAPERRIALNAQLDELTEVMSYISELNRAYGEIDASSKERDALIIEMSLILPAESVRKAEKASRAQLERDTTMYLPQDLRANVADAVAAMLDFAADIRKQLGMGTLSSSPASTENYIDQVIEKIVRKEVSDQQLADAILKKMAETRSRPPDGK